MPRCHFYCAVISKSADGSQDSICSIERVVLAVEETFVETFPSS